MNKNLDIAVERTAASWFPVNPIVLNTIHRKMEGGCYEGNREGLIEDIKSDFSLFLFCLRELRERLQDGKSSKRSAADEDAGSAGERFRTEKPRFADVLDDVGVDELKRILSTPISRISSFSMDHVTEAQAARLRNSMLSASTAEALSRKFDLDPSVGYTCALLRQLGLTLIAWNYPNVYRRALETMAAFRTDAEADLDIVLHNSLGFSPALMGVRFAERWGLSPGVVSVVRGAVRPKRAVPESFPRAIETAEEKPTSVLSKICSVGEAFARANDPDHYPRAREDWENAERIIKRYLGPMGIQTIYRKAEQLSAEYSRYCPSLLKIQANNESAFLRIESEHARTLFERNVHLSICPPKVRERLAEVYSLMGIRGGADSRLKKLIHEVVPSLGFDVCAVFTLDPSVGALLPVTKIGEPAFIRLAPVSLMNALSHCNPISRAFSRRKAIYEEGFLKSGAEKRYIAGPLGERRQIGVLYLEVSLECPESGNGDPLRVFKALLQCLNDLLHLD